jgi:serine/threonine protein kinase
LEEVNAGQIASKYFTDPSNFNDNVTEIAVLKDLQGLPYVAQLVGINTRPASIPANVVGPPVNVEALNFPVALMGKAKSDLHNKSLFTSWDDIERTVIQVLKGIAVMHGQGIVHRDIKPANMLMTSAKEVWISDFGRAKYIDGMIPETEEVYTGTFVTSAPELLMKYILREDTPTDYKKSDMWAVGASLYRIMTGTYLFDGNPDEVLDQMFIRSGFPQPSDGVTFDLYEEMDANGLLVLGWPIANYRHVANAYKGRILTRTRFPPADPARLETFATVIQELLSFDPEDRPTALEALHMITGEDYPAPPRRILYDEYINTLPLPAAVAGPAFELSCYKTLQTAYRYILKPELMFTVDRALLYTRALLQKNTATRPDVVFLVALAIADSLLDTSAGNREFTPRKVAEALTIARPVPAALI